MHRATKHALDAVHLGGETRKKRQHPPPVHLDHDGRLGLQYPQDWGLVDLFARLELPEFSDYVFLEHSILAGLYSKA